MADRRGIVVPLFIIAFILLAPEPRRFPSDPFDDRPTLEDVIAEEHRALSTVGNSSWDPEFGLPGHLLNVTGLDEETEFAWDALPRLKAKAQEHLDLLQTGRDPDSDSINGEPTLYQNVTGIVRGKWTRSTLQLESPRLNLTAYAPPAMRPNVVESQPFSRNLTGEEGEVAIGIREKSVASPALALSNITEMNAAVKITDGSQWEAELKGVYFMDIGQAILTTTSLKFAGIFALPHMTLTAEQFEASRTLLNQSIARTIGRQENGLTESHNPWTSRADGSIDESLAAPSCDLIVWLRQLRPGTSPLHATSSALSFVENELRFPTGALLPPIPEIRFSMLAFSPDCGYIIESGGPVSHPLHESSALKGPKLEIQYRHGRHHLTAFNLLQALQLWLFMRQMNEASTPSTRSKISLYSISMLALGDGFSTMVFVTLSLFLPGLWTNLAGTGFISFIGVSFFGLKFLINIWAAQAPERVRSARAQIEEEQRRAVAIMATMDRLREERLARLGASTENATTVTTTNTTQDTATTPSATVPPSNPTLQAPIDTGATPVFYMPSDQGSLLPIQAPGAGNAEPSQAVIEARIPSFGSLYTRFYLLLLATAFLSLNAITWPKTARRTFFVCLALIYLSFWCPQIFRNVQRNCRRALKWEFVLGQSVLRLAPFAYFYAYEPNIIFADVNVYILALLAGWVWVQIVVLGSQELVGPRWFIRNDWAPPAYDYHPVLREDEEGATMPIGASPSAATTGTAPSSPTLDRPSAGLLRASSAKDTKGKGKRVFDCAICMQELEVPVVESGMSQSETAGLAGGLLARRMYMVTPCRHIFHSACLEGWMKFRLQCPICREELPPL